MQKLTKERYRFVRRRQQLIVNQRKRRAWRKKKEKRALFPSSLAAPLRELIAPNTFNISDQAARRSLVSFIRELRTLVVAKRQPVLIVFSSTTKMFSDGTLLFVAELRRMIRLSERRVPIRCIPPRNAKVLQVLEQIGVLALLKCRKRVTPTDGDVVHWRVAWGTEVLGEKYDDILKSYDGKLTERISRGFYHGLTEAMTNSRQHAYIKPRLDGLKVAGEPTEWWMFSQEKDGVLTVSFCDLGIGIPATLPIKKPQLWQRLTALFGQVTDGQAILEAISDSKTRTGKSYRGKGLRQLLEVVQESDNGVLAVYSNRGHYRYKNGQSSQSDYKESISGTLIAWQIPITEPEGEQYAHD